LKFRGLVEQHLDEAFSLKVEQPPRKRQLRCSGLPYCPLLDVLTLSDEPELADLHGALFTSMGTAAHEAIQLFMTMAPMGVDVWGSWKCSNCGKELKYRFRPKDCCNLPMLYQEVDLRVGPLTGHIDLVTQFKRKWWHLSEFKTIGPNPTKPKRQHLLQIRHYIAMLALQHKIHATGYSVVYVMRQFLDRRIFGPYGAKGSLQETKDWLFRAIRGYKAATQARKNPNRANLINVVKERPCKSRDDWDQYMSRAEYTFKKSECMLLPYCTRGDRACLKKVEEILA
jgi:hypothetical protein